jgi:hypothetical protein
VTWQPCEQTHDPCLFITPAAPHLWQTLPLSGAPNALLWTKPLRDEHKPIPTATTMQTITSSFTVHLRPVIALIIHAR